MKALILLIGMLFGTSWLVQAQTIEEPKEYDQKEEYKNRRKKVNIKDIPPSVKKGFASSQYGDMQIVEAYVLSTEEANKILEGSRNIEVLTEETMLYELKVENGDQSATLYFTEQGKLYSVAEEEGIG